MEVDGAILAKARIVTATGIVSIALLGSFFLISEQVQESRLIFFLPFRNANNAQSAASMRRVSIPSFWPHLKREGATAGA